MAGRGLFFQNEGTRRSRVGAKRRLIPVWEGALFRPGSVRPWGFLHPCGWSSLCPVPSLCSSGVEVGDLAKDLGMRAGFKGATPGPRDWVEIFAAV